MRPLFPFLLADGLRDPSEVLGLPAGSTWYGHEGNAGTISLSFLTDLVRFFVSCVHYTSRGIAHPTFRFLLGRMFS